MKYIHPKSLTWWSGVISIATGVAMITCKTCNLDDFAAVLAGFNGGGEASPANLIILGTALIGIREKLESIGSA